MALHPSAASREIVSQVEPEGTEGIVTDGVTARDEDEEEEEEED